MEVEIILVTGAALGGLFGLGYYFAPQCRGCGARFSGRWDHQRKDGGPDLRFNDNRRRCTRCGSDMPS